MRVNLKIAFAIALLFLLLGPLFLPKLHLFYFSPFLVLSLYASSLFGALLRAFLCGLLVDLLSSSFFFEEAALSFSLATLLLWSQKRNFFEDKAATLPLMTTLFSVLVTLTMAFLLFFFRHQNVFSWKWCVTDLLGMSMVDGLYGYLFFSLPFQLTHKLSKLWRTYLQKRS